MRAVWLIAKSVLIEAIRRKEIYAVVLVSVLMIGAAMTVNFFHLEGIEKFYREIALDVMSLATAATAIVLSARQLPREFENRTIYPMMAKPIARSQFLLGKLLGTVMASTFCLALFMAVYFAGAMYLSHTVPWALMAQYIYLQILMTTIVSTMGFWLSLMLNLDAAITVCAVICLASSTISTIIVYISRDYSAMGRRILQFFIFALPQLQLFDLGDKATHGSDWPPLSASTLGMLTAYAAIYASAFFGLALLAFRRKAL
jgi:Cu-processing system permease protein